MMLETAKAAAASAAGLRTKVVAWAGRLGEAVDTAVQAASEAVRAAGLVWAPAPVPVRVRRPRPGGR